MKQVLSVADLATMLNLVNRAITKMESEWCFPITMKDYHSKKEYQETLNERIKKLKEDPYYLSIIHLKKALENTSVNRYNI